MATTKAGASGSVKTGDKHGSIGAWRPSLNIGEQAIQVHDRQTRRFPGVRLQEKIQPTVYPSTKHASYINCAGVSTKKSHADTKYKLDKPSIRRSIFTPRALLRHTHKWQHSAHFQETQKKKLARREDLEITRNSSQLLAIRVWCFDRAWYGLYTSPWKT